MAKIMQEAMPLEDFKDWDFKGSPLKKKVKPPPPPQPKMPKVKNMLKLKDIILNELKHIHEGRHKALKNKDGIRFMGYSVSVEMTDGKILQGWMPEADFNNFRRLISRDGKINTDNMEF